MQRTAAGNRLVLQRCCRNLYRDNTGALPAAQYLARRPSMHPEPMPSACAHRIMLRARRVVRRYHASRLPGAVNMDSRRKLLPKLVPAAAVALWILLRAGRDLHRYHSRFLRLRLDARPRLLTEPVRAAAPTGNRRVLRCSGRLLRDDADWLRKYRRRVSRRGDFLHARPVRCPAAADRLVLRGRWLVLRHHRRRLHRDLEQWRFMHPEFVCAAIRLLLRSEWLLLEYD